MGEGLCLEYFFERTYGSLPLSMLKLLNIDNIMDVFIHGFFSVSRESSRLLQRLKKVGLEDELKCFMGKFHEWRIDGRVKMIKVLKVFWIFKIGFLYIHVVVVVVVVLVYLLVWICLVGGMERRNDGKS